MVSAGAATEDTRRTFNESTRSTRHVLRFLERTYKRSIQSKGKMTLFDLHSGEKTSCTERGDDVDIL